MYTYRKLIISVCFIIATFCSVKLFASEDRPNILLFTIDACRPDHMSCYGYSRKTTPNIDRLANEGVLFSNAFSQSAWTTPCMISIFTSLYPFTHHVDARGKTLSDSVRTLPEVLKESGYVVPVLPRFVDVPNYHRLGFEAVEIEKPVVNKEDELLQLMDAYKDQRFFIWYHYSGVHLPYNPPSPYDKMFLPDADSKQIDDSEGVSIVRKNVIVKHGSVKFKDKDRDTIRALYDGQLRQLDYYIGRLVTRMRSWGILKNTIIILTADHGEELLEHSFVGHASTSLNAKLYDEFIRIPLIIRYPKKLSNKTIDVLVQQIDIMPTILDLIGLSVPKSLEGNSLLPLIKGKSGFNPSPIYCETNKGGYQSTKKMKKIKIRCIRTKQWKLISTANGDTFTNELYDLINDPREKNNVIVKYPDISSGLINTLYMKVQSDPSIKELSESYGTK